MGLVKRPNRRMNWQINSIYGDPFVRRIMSRSRFDAITKDLHWWNVSNIPPNDRAERNKVDGFWALGDFIEVLVQNWQRYYDCGQLLNIDEMCIFFKGRHRCRCYNPSKPNKWHLKAYCLNDPTNGYGLYRGSSEVRPPGVSSTVWPVKYLTESQIFDGD